MPSDNDLIVYENVQYLTQTYSLNHVILTIKTNFIECTRTYYNISHEYKILNQTVSIHAYYIHAV